MRLIETRPFNFDRAKQSEETPEFSISFLKFYSIHLKNYFDLAKFKLKSTKFGHEANPSPKYLTPKSLMLLLEEVFIYELFIYFFTYKHQYAVF